MKLWHLRRGTGKRCWGLLEPAFIEHEAALVIVSADIVNFSEHMGTWIMQGAPILRAAGYSEVQIGQMMEHAYFAKYQVVGFNPVTGLADVIARNKSAFTSRPDEPPQILTGKVIVIGAVIAVIIIWYLFSTHEETATIEPPEPLWIVTYKEKAWYADCIAHTPRDKYHYKRCFWPPFTISSTIRGIEAREGTYDRLVFLGTHFEKVAGKLFWHWYNWDFFDVDFVGFLTQRAENLYMLKEGYSDTYAPEKPWIASIEDHCTSTTAWWGEMTKFW